MTFDLDVTGVRLDGSRAEASWEHTMGGGELRYDEQSIQAGETPTSEVEWEWDGYTRRTMELSFTFVSPTRPGSALEPHAALAAIHSAHRGGEEPAMHRITGRLARSLQFDHPWAIVRMTSTESSDNTAISATVFLIELDPDAVSSGGAPITPGAGEPTVAAPPPSGASLTPEQLQRLSDYEFDPYY